MIRDWKASAACRDQAPDFDVSVDGETWKERTARIKAALATCARCPTIVDCRAETDPLIDEGVRGGELYDRNKNVPATGIGRPRSPIKHGTPTGYRRHLRAGEVSCGLCREAELRYRQDRRAKKAS